MKRKIYSKVYLIFDFISEILDEFCKYCYEPEKWPPDLYTIDPSNLTIVIYPNEDIDDIELLVHTDDGP